LISKDIPLFIFFILGSAVPVVSGYISITIGYRIYRVISQLVVVEQSVVIASTATFF
jgi:hypothetical protein